MNPTNQTKKHFSIRVIAFATVVVLAEDADEAYEILEETIDYGSLARDEATAKEITSEEEIHRELRHADTVSHDLLEAQKAAKADPFFRKQGGAQ